MSAKSFISVPALAAVTVLASLAVSTASASITVSTVAMSNPSNAMDPSDGDLFAAGIQNFGSVAYTYNIGATEVTNAQYAAFLNAVARTDTFNLYNTNMAGSFGGITRSGSPGSYT
jgi:formylglycine-generating enzyme required for sulfatase activity